MLHVDLPAILPTITIMLILRMGSVMTIGFEKGIFNAKQSEFDCQ